MLRYFVAFILITLFILTALLIYAAQGVMDASEKNVVRQFPFQFKHYAQNDTLRVSTFNMGYLSGMTNNLPVERSKSLFQENLAQAISVFQIESPDFIGFQEIDFNSSRSYYVDQPKVLVNALKYPLVYQSTNWDKNYVPFPYWPVSMQFGKMNSGQATFGRFPLIDQQTITLSKPVNASFFYNAFYLDRLVQMTYWQVGEDTLCLLNVHLEAFDQETRNIQASVVVDIYQQNATSYPTLMIGDFNSRPEYVATDDAMKTIMSANDISSAITEKNYLSDSTHQYTFNTDVPYQMIDYILYNPSRIQKVSAEVLQNAGQISDHFPIAMKFTIKD